MKQVIQNYRTGVLKVDDVPAPITRAGGLVVANRVSLISAGTEKATVNTAQRNLLGKAVDRPDLVRKIFDSIRKDGFLSTAQRVFERLDTPAALGYSCAGTVLEVGQGCSEFSVGDRVACAGQNYASHAEVVWVPKNLCARIPEGVDFEGAAFVTLGTIAVQGIRQTEPRLGDRVAVIGLGLLGQLTVQLLKASGCRVLGSDLDPTKLQLAAAMGADAVAHAEDLADAAMEFTGGYGVDAVIVTASTKDNGPIEVAGTIARTKGRVVVVGAVGMDLPREPYYRKELELRLSMSYGPGRYDPEYEEKGRDYPYGYVRWTEQRNMDAFLELIQQRKVSLQQLVTHRFPIERAEEAYRLMIENTEPYLGLLITYPQPDATRHASIVTMRPASAPGAVTVGLLGAGHHVRDMLLSALSGLQGVTIRAVCTASGITAKSLGAKVNAAYCTTDFREVLADPSVNTVVIGTRHNMHALMVVEALQAGKHVFVEKPLCLTGEELDRIGAVYREHESKGLHLLAGFNRRFSPHAARASAFFQGRANPLVMVYRVNAGPLAPDHWAQDPDVGGGRIVGEACHFVDYMQAFCGARPVSVHARRIARHTSGITDDQCAISLAFADGSIGTIVYTGGGDPSLPKERFEAFGDRKALTMQDFQQTEFYDRGKRTVFKTGGRDKGFHEEMRRFVATVQHGGPPPIRFEEIDAVTRTCLLAVASLQTGAVYDV